MTILFGIDRLLADPALRAPLEGKRVALLAHPASVTADLTHSLDALVAAGVNISAVFGPPHGVRGDLDRKSVVWGESGSERVALGGRRVIKKKKTTTLQP